MFSSLCRCGNGSEVKAGKRPCEGSARLSPASSAAQHLARAVELHGFGSVGKTGTAMEVSNPPIWEDTR